MSQQSILAAVSGIQANQTYLNEVANNIANVNTVGYKQGTVQFQDLLSQQLSGASAPAANGSTGGINPVAIGSGVRVGANELNMSEGTLEQTGQPTDVAINGSGYLIVNSGGQQLYTRDGSLTVDANGNLTTQQGGLVQGWQASATGATGPSGPIGPIKIPQGETIGANETQNVAIGGNLPSWNGTGTAPVITKTVNAYDALGNVVPVTLTFTGVTGKADQWTLQGSVTDPTTGKAVNLWSTSTPPTIQFADTGSGTSSYTPAPAMGEVASITGATEKNGQIVLPVTTMPTGYNFQPPAGSPSGTALTWNFTFPAPGGTGELTQYNAPESLNITSDGYAAGSLESFSIGSDGTITGSFSNGQTLSLGQIALANFANVGGLADQGGGLYAAGPNSGQPQIGAPGSGGRGQLLGGELEQSNVDLGSQLTDLINAQEAYTANTKVLTTTSAAMQALEAVQ